LTSGKVCRLNYEEALKSTDCTAEKNFGFDTERPCILIKLNKIVSWTPADSSNVTIQCQGETSVDKDNLRAVDFYSVGDKESFKTGVLERKYFPYFNQKNYRAPFVFARFDIPPNTLVNIECKAYAPNIDNADRLNRRGQTKLSLYVNRK
jgi:sodium/potassium-transporting ATPase subunit beta